MVLFTALQSRMGFPSSRLGGSRCTLGRGWELGTWLSSETQYHDAGKGTKYNICLLQVTRRKLFDFSHYLVCVYRFFFNIEFLSNII